MYQRQFRVHPALTYADWERGHFGLRGQAQRDTALAWIDSRTSQAIRKRRRRCRSAGAVHDAPWRETHNKRKAFWLRRAVFFRGKK
jgi:hypothetical protein